MDRSKSFSRLAIAILLGLLPIISGGCGFILSHGPPQGHEQMQQFSCTESNAGPIIDVIWGGLNVIGALAAAADPDYYEDAGYEPGAVVAVGLSWGAISGAAAVVGFNKSKECREAKLQLAQRQARGQVARTEPPGRIVAAEPLPPRESLPPSVNDSLRTNWRVLDGAEIYYELEGENRTRHEVLVRYTVSTNHRGEAELEQHATRLVRRRSGVVGNYFRDSYLDQSRTLVNLERPSTIEVYSQRTAYDNNVAEGATHYTIEGTQLIYDSAGTRRSGWVPTGVLPSSLLWAVVAALPTSLPSVLYVWAMDDDVWPFNVEPVRLDIGERQSVEIRVPRVGESCGREARTDRREVPAIWVTLTKAAEKTRWPILASSPYLALLGGGKGDECVKIP